MAEECERLYLVKNFESTFDSSCLMDADSQHLQTQRSRPSYSQSQTYRTRLPFHFMEITFTEVNNLLKKKLFAKQTEEFNVVKDIFEDYTNTGPNRKFVSVLLGQSPSNESRHSTMQLSYWSNFNQNLLRSLRGTMFNKIQVQLRCQMQESRLGKWCLWNNTESRYNFEILLQNAKGTMSADGTMETNKFRADEVEAVDLICAGKGSLRIKFKMDILLVRDPSCPLPPKGKIQPNSMKLAEHSILQALYENEDTKDIRIIVGDDVELKAHKFILAAHSDVFKVMITSKMTEGESGIIHIVDISEAAMRELIRYFYGMEIPALELDCETAMELFQAAHKYKLKELELAATSLFLFRNGKWYTADTALEVYYFTKNLPECDNLNNHLLRILSRVSSVELRDSKRFKELSPSDVIDLTFKLNDLLQID